LKTIPGVDIRFVEVTSQSLLKHGQIDFPAAVNVDLPFKVSKGELDTALTDKGAGTADYLIVFDVALAKNTRKVGHMKKAPSKMIVGYRQEVNPEHTRLQNSLNMAQMAAQSANMNVAMTENQYCQGLACIGKLVAMAGASKKRDEAQANLAEAMRAFNATPAMIEVPVKQPYSYDVANVKATKTMTVHYYVIDLGRKRYFKGTFDVVEHKTFEVAYSIRENDPDKTAEAAKHDSEDDVVGWEKQASTIKLSRLVRHYLDNGAQIKPLPNLVVLRKEMLKDRNTALAHYKANTFEASTEHDPRFKSVVAVFQAGGMGSGFYVRPDVVLTNYHVVEEQKFVNIKLYDGPETFGKVIARDAGLDLALVRVQARGIPVRFYNKNKIELGSTVEVIGHPKRFEFSITRGIVSAIRKHKSVILGNKGPDVLQVQYDAPTSNGNSGGPVFLGDRVIAIVDWGASTSAPKISISAFTIPRRRNLSATILAAVPRRNRT